MINAAWHRKHKMPKYPSMDQRSAWRQEHRKYCDCWNRKTKNINHK